MKLTALLLLLVVVGVALASPRSPLRFTHRRGQEAELAAADEAAAEADPAEAEEPAKPRFRIAGRPSGSSFTPKRSSSVAPEPSSDAAPVEATVAAPVPVARAPAQASLARPRTRGSRTFVESIKISNIPIEASQLEVLEKSKQSLQRISSRPSSRPSSRVPTSQAAAPASRTPSRPSSVRAPQEQPSTPTNPAELETIASKAPPASASKPAGGDQEQRRQRLLSLKKRPRAGASVAAPRAEESKPEEDPAQASSAPVEAAEEKMMDKKTDSMQEKSSATKLDEEVTKTLDETIKAETEQEGEPMKKEKKDMAAKETVAEKAEEKMPEEAEAAASAVTPEPEATTTTTAVPTSRPRRINSLSKLRASRPVGGSSTGGARTRTSAPAAAAPESPANEVQPRLSSRRGGRGNSRGGAALATSTRISRPSSRVQASRTPVTDGEEAGAAEIEAPAAGTTGSSGSFRRKLPSPSLRRNQVPVNIRSSAGDQPEEDGARVAGEDGRGARRARHSLVPEAAPVGLLRAGRSAAPERKQVGTEEKKTRRAGVRSLIDRLRGRKTNRMRIEEARAARGEVAEKNVKEELKVINELTGIQSKSELQSGKLAAESVTTSKPATPAAVRFRPRNLSPDKQGPRGRVERRRRPIKFAAVATAPPQSSTTAQSTTLPTPSSTAAKTATSPSEESTTLDTTSSAAAETTTSPSEESTADANTLSTPSTAAETITLSTFSLTNDETATILPESSTTAEPTTLSVPSTTVDTTTTPPQSSTTAETTTLPPQTSTTAETTTLPPQSSTTAETTTLPPQSSTTAETTTSPPQTTTTQTTPRPRRPLPSIERTTRQKQPTTTQSPPTTLAATTKPPSPRTTTHSPASTPESARSSPSWKPRVAPEDPVDAFNRGGFRFQPHPSSESDITRRRGEVVLTEVGTLEDTPPHQKAAILRGLGGRRRGLARPPASKHTTTMEPPSRNQFSETDYYYDDY